MSTFLTHPAFIIPAFTLIGFFFAAQEWIDSQHMDYQIDGAAVLFESWVVQYFLWGVIWWLLWRLFRPFIQDATLTQIFAVGLPASLVVILLEELVYAPFCRGFPKFRQLSYWHCVRMECIGDGVESMAIFWGGFFFFRAASYYHRLREKESTAAQLEVELANAKIAALRMQLNPHFLFNTMNSISSLMRIDVEAADSLLEQLGSLLRMTLERKDVQLIPLHDEIEFTETYLAMQDKRYAGRVTRTVFVDPELHDSLVPAMILQPIVENAYAHGLSKLDRGGELSIEVTRVGGQMRALITNSGLGLNGFREETNGHGVGLTNVKNRLRLHYGDACAFSIRELDAGRVQVSIALPLQLSAAATEAVTRYATV